MLTNRNIFKIYMIFIFIFSVPVFAYAIDTSRPGPENIPTKVNVQLYIIDIDEINDAAQSFAANIFIKATWKDPRLVTGNEKTTYSREEVWSPNFQIINRQKVFKSFPEIVEVEQDGTVSYKQRLVGNFSQPLDLKKFPFDKQRLQFQFISAGHRPGDVEMVEEAIGISDILSIPDWKITGIEFKDKEWDFIPGQPTNVGMILSVNAERYVQFYFYKFIIPLILIVFMSWIVFWIDPTDYTAQISIAITSMLTLIAYQYLAGSSLPEVPYLTRMDSLMIFSTALVFATLIEVTVTSVLTRKNKVELGRSIDYYCRFIFPIMFFLFLGHRILTI